MGRDSSTLVLLKLTNEVILHRYLRVQLKWTMNHYLGDAIV